MMRSYIALFCLALHALHANQLSELNKLPFNKVIIWGHKVGTHTHSYIHEGFYKAFKHLGYDTYWLDNNDSVEAIDFSNSLFITEGQVEQKMPIRDDCFYVLHYCGEVIPDGSDRPSKYKRKAKYKDLYDQHKCLDLWMYLINKDTYIDYDLSDLHALAPYVEFSLKSRAIYMPWATDLLPHEIDAVKARLSVVQKKNIIHYVATLGAGKFGPRKQVMQFKKACEQAHIPFDSIQFNFHSASRNISSERTRALVEESIMAPAIQCSWQVKAGYIPCRIFKHISYGQWGITNSKTVYELFNKKITYNKDPYQLFFDAQKRLKTVTKEELYELMDFVKNNHTYINRVQVLSNAISRIQKGNYE